MLHYLWSSLAIGWTGQETIDGVENKFVDIGDVVGLKCPANETGAVVVAVVVITLVDNELIGNGGKRRWTDTVDDGEWLSNPPGNTKIYYLN